MSVPDVVLFSADPEQEDKPPDHRSLRSMYYALRDRLPPWVTIQFPSMTEGDDKQLLLLGFVVNGAPSRISMALVGRDQVLQFGFMEAMDRAVAINQAIKRICKWAYRVVGELAIAGGVNGTSIAQARGRLTDKREFSLPCVAQGDSAESPPTGGTVVEIVFTPPNSDEVDEAT